MGTCCGENADHKQLEDHICKSKKMEGDEGLNLNTVACLRGRLLAERQASRVAKEEEESMGNKLVDLENLLRQEIKLRDKAERKLSFLKKKLESFTKSSKAEQLGDPGLSEKCENSCGSSSTSSVFIYSKAKIPALPENADNQNVSEASTKDCDSQITDCWSSNSDKGYSSPQILNKNSNPKSESEDLKNYESRLSNLSTKSSVTDNESDHADFFDNSLALVPMNMPMKARSQATSDQNPVNGSAFEALDALRLAKQRLQSSLGTRQMMQVGLI